VQTIFWFEDLKETDHSKDLGVDGDNMRIDLKEIWWEVMDWMYLAQDRDQWLAVMNNVMKFRVP